VTRVEGGETWGKGNKKQEGTLGSHKQQAKKTSMGAAPVLKKEAERRGEQGGDRWGRPGRKEKTV